MKRKKFEWTGRLILIIFSLILVLSLIFFITKQTHKNTTEQLLTEYMNYINKHEYEKMYKMISKEHSSNISMEEFVKRNKNIYEGLETKDLSIKILNEKSNGKEISYLTSFNTLAGEVKFQNEVNFIKEKFEYKLVWKDSIIFPQLESTDKVRIDTVEAERGQILDRNGKVLAGKGVASSVGLVPGKIQDKENTIIKLAELLEVDIDVIKNKLSAEWVKDDSFVPVTAVIGLDTGILDPVEDYGNEGLSWQKDSSWGDYYVTTLHETEPATLENAMIYSDNIYFAKVALKLGENNLTSFLEKLGFNKEIPFDIKMSISQYSNTEGIKSEIQLADSGYGQGQILINPLHLASIYSAFSNDGNIIEPTLLYNPNYNPNIWMPEVIQKESIHTVLETMKKVISEPTATGYGLHREEYTLAGKTGTAEIKLSKEDATGTELGWMAVFTTDPNIENPILLISMVEDVKNIGGSGYVVQKDKRVLDQYLR